MRARTRSSPLPLEAVADRIEGLTVRKTIVAPTVVNVVAN